MALTASCVRCSAPVLESPLDPGSRWCCPEHGATQALWRPPESSYDAFIEHLEASRSFPTYLPWPMGPGWTVTDFAAVSDWVGRTAATLTCTSGTSDLDGPVDVLVVAEEPGTGLGARCARSRYDDPGPEIAGRPPTARVRIDALAVNLWDVSTSSFDGEFDRSVVAGEAGGRWLWIVLRPASALLMLRDDWILRDVSGIGPSLVEMPFAGHRPAW
jgi:hypothetical protein